PIYPATEGLQQNRLRKLLDQVFQLLERNAALPDYLPAELCRQHHFLPLLEALRVLHRPPPDVALQQLLQGEHPAQQRLAFEELLANYLSLRRLRDQAQSQAAPVLKPGGGLQAALLQSLPFQLTCAQRRVGREISRDLARPQPMLRLVQGDVGSGKTLVAVLAALQAVENGYQAVLMAPTEILAEQHYLNFDQWLSPLGLRQGYLSGKIKGRKRDAV